MIAIVKRLSGAKGFAKLTGSLSNEQRDVLKSIMQ
jgi:hypothetical protein